MSVAIKGSCLCGSIKFEVVNPPSISHCYCSRCRKKSGAGRTTGMLVKPEQVQFACGENKIRRWYMPSAKSFGTSVCETCGSAVPHLTRSRGTMIVPAGSIDDVLSTPVANYEWQSRANWVNLDETELPCYETHE